MVFTRTASPQLGLVPHQTHVFKNHVLLVRLYWIKSPQEPTLDYSAFKDQCYRLVDLAQKLALAVEGVKLIEINIYGCLDVYLSCCPEVTGGLLVSHVVIYIFSI